MKTFIGENFLLSNEIARRLYHEVAAQQPILDFHCHLCPKDIAENRQFSHLTEIWLEGDHYKWRAMRANGTEEHFCTGNASAYEKFLAWARTVPYTLRNPLYHWTHLELQRYFDIGELLDERSAPSVWEQANEKLKHLPVRAILKKFNVEALCTTDDPADDLRYHRQIAEQRGPTRMFPTFRPDWALEIGNPEFIIWLDRLEKAADVEVRDLNSFLDALRNRHDDFHAVGCRLSDHGLKFCYASPCSERKANEIFARARNGKSIEPEDREQFAAFMMLFFGRIDTEKGWTKQLHLGALRNVNHSAREALGQDTGFDAVGQFPQIDSLAAYLNLLARENALPRLVLYNSNAADTFAFATLAGAFQDASIPGKIQYGSAWWFLDQKQGITAQLDALSNCGLLSRFIGMVTDSRSLMSYPRHEYFRRILCDIVGRDIESSELPSDLTLMRRLIEDICHRNAKQYLRLPEVY